MPLDHPLQPSRPQLAEHCNQHKPTTALCSRGWRKEYSQVGCRVLMTACSCWRQRLLQVRGAWLGGVGASPQL